MTEPVDILDDADWIVESKLMPRRPNISLVSRPALLGAMDDILGSRLALVIAPAGYGKSTLLFQWSENLKNRGIRYAWLTLDEEDSAPNQFLAYVVLALARSGMAVGELAVGALNGYPDTPVNIVLKKLVKIIARAGENYVLFLDDFHFLTGHKVSDLLKEFVALMPDNLSLVLSSRRDPMIGSQAMLIDGHALKFGMSDLKLTQDETRKIIESADLDIDISELHAVTEGWPVAVQLARVQLVNNPSVMPAKASSNQMVASFLTEQVLSSIDSGVREILFSICFLDRFNQDLVESLFGNSLQDSIFEKLKPIEAFLLPVERDGNWFRLHHLFAEYLRETAIKSQKNKQREISSQASQWFSENGYLLEAVKYSSTAQDYDKCELLINQAGGWRIILYDGISVLRSLLKFIPEAYISTSPRLLVARAYLHCKDGEQHEARGLLDISKSLHASDADPAFERDHLVVESMVNVYEDRRRWVRSLDIIRDRRSAIQNMDPVEHGTLKCEEVLILLAQGKISEASDTLKSAFSAMRASESVLGLNYCYLHSAIIALLKGDMIVARANIARSLDLAESNFGFDSGLKHMAKSLELAQKVWVGELDRNDISGFSDTLKYLENYDGWVELFIAGLDGAFHLSEQVRDAEFGLELSERFLKVARSRRLERLDVFAQILKMKALADLGRQSQALEIHRHLRDWVSRHLDAEHTRDWQCLFLAASSLPVIDGADQGECIRTLNKVIVRAEEIGARLHEIRLRIALSAALEKHSGREKPMEAYQRALSLAARDNITGPFLCERDARRKLRKARELIRNKEDELIVHHFVESLLNRIDDLEPKKKSTVLSSRELEILEKLGLGQSNKEIAIALELTENTVKFHLKNIYTKLSVNRRAQAISEGHRLGLLD